MAERAKAKKEEQEAGAPAWMVTYGDMMSLLLCFFIMLVAMSEIKSDKFQKLLESVKKAFGYDLGAEVAPGTNPRTTGVFEKLQMFSTPKGLKNVYGGSESMNVRGKDFLCKNLREKGTCIAVGDKVGFSEGSAEVPREMKDVLDILVEEVIKDYPNRVLIRGHTSAQEAGRGTADWRLSFLRAQAVGEYFKQKGINPRRFRLSACGSFDPMDTNLTREGRTANRRVEIVVSEELVQNVIPRRESHE